MGWLAAGRADADAVVPPPPGARRSGRHRPGFDAKARRGIDGEYMRALVTAFVLVLAACDPKPAGPAAPPEPTPPSADLHWQALIPPGNQPASLYYLSASHVLPAIVFSCVEGRRVKVAMANPQGAPLTSFGMSSGDSAQHFEVDPASSDNVLGFSKPVPANGSVFATFRASGGLSTSQDGLYIGIPNAAERAQIESFFAACDRG